MQGQGVDLNAIGVDDRRIRADVQGIRAPPKRLERFQGVLCLPHFQRANLEAE